MLASASALEFEKLVEEDLGSVSVSVGDLIAADSRDMAIKSWDFGPSSITEEAVAEMLKESYFPSSRVKIPPPGQTVPEPEEGYAVVFRDFFTCGLRLPYVPFLRRVLETFNVQVHHLTPMAFLTLSKFCWACVSYGAEPDVDTFCAYYDLQKQPKKKKEVREGKEVEVTYQYGSCTFMSKRNQGVDRLELSFCQKGKWDRGWLEQWFYVKTYGVRGTTEDGAEVVEYPLTSRMEDMAPHTRVDPPEEKSPARKACDRAFAAACRYSGGRDLVEEIMASNYWPLGKDNPAFR